MRRNKEVKYSYFKKALRFDSLKEFNDDHANFTHYLHSKPNGVSHFFKDAALDFLEVFNESSLAKEPEYQLALPIQWDVPFPPVSQYDFTFVDLFAGIGGFRLAFQSVNGKCVFTSEWNKYAKKTYEANFGEVPFGDITQIHEDEIPEHDILLGGFPCQPFSIAGVSKKKSLGKTHGFLDETQGTLFYEIVRILKKKKPKAFLLENVKNLRSHDKKNTFRIIMRALDELGYQAFDEVLDAKHFGVPQHRERVFIAGFRKDCFDFSAGLRFIFPQGEKRVPKIKSILDKNPDPRFTLTDHLWRYLQKYAAKHKEMGNGFGFGLTDLNGVARTLSARYYKDGSEVLIPQEPGKNPRRLTPNECKALMGFPRNYKIDGIGVSDTQLYKQFGNSVAVPVVTEIAGQMMIFIRSHMKRKARLHSA